MNGAAMVAATVKRLFILWAEECHESFVHPTVDPAAIEPEDAFEERGKPCEHHGACADPPWDIGTQRTPQPGMTMGNFALSPNGRILAASGATRGGARDIYVLNVDGSGLRRLTETRVHDRSPAWSPDGRKIAFTSERDGNTEIYVMNADGSEQLNVSNSPAADELPVWVPPRR